MTSLSYGNLTKISIFNRDKTINSFLIVETINKRGWNHNVMMST